RAGLGGGLSRISKEEGTHNPNFAPDGSAYVDTFSATNTPPSQGLQRGDGTLITVLNENKVNELGSYKLSPTEFLKVKAHDGTELYASMIRPPNFDPSKKYPIIVFTYGGPKAQVVLNQ